MVSSAATIATSTANSLYGPYAYRGFALPTQMARNRSVMQRAKEYITVRFAASSCELHTQRQSQG
jgi:hypothetical protein